MLALHGRQGWAAGGLAVLGRGFRSPAGAGGGLPPSRAAVRRRPGRRRGRRDRDDRRLRRAARRRRPPRRASPASRSTCAAAPSRSPSRCTAVGAALGADPLAVHPRRRRRPRAAGHLPRPCLGARGLAGRSARSPRARASRSTGRRTTVPPAGRTSLARAVGNHVESRYHAGTPASDDVTAVRLTSAVSTASPRSRRSARPARPADLGRRPAALRRQRKDPRRGGPRRRVRAPERRRRDPASRTGRGGASGSAVRDPSCVDQLDGPADGESGAAPSLDGCAELVTLSIQLAVDRDDGRPRSRGEWPSVRATSRCR